MEHDEPNRIGCSRGLEASDDRIISKRGRGMDRVTKVPWIIKQTEANQAG